MKKTSRDNEWLEINVVGTIIQLFEMNPHNGRFFMCELSIRISPITRSTYFKNIGQKSTIFCVERYIEHLLYFAYSHYACMSPRCCMNAVIFSFYELVRIRDNQIRVNWVLTHSNIHEIRFWLAYIYGGTDVEWR